jgi:hypothetical protein
MEKAVFCILFVAISLVSCESYLDVPIEKVSITDKNVFETYVSARDYTTKLYSDLVNLAYQHNVGLSTTAEKRAGFPNVASDQIREFTNDINWELRYFDENNFTQDFCVNNILSNRTDPRSYWRFAWLPIRRANVVLEKSYLIKDAQSQSDVDALRGQAYFARAFTYSFMLDLWGGMPYITKVLNFQDDLGAPRLSYHETVMRIVADCDSAAKLLPTRWNTLTNLQNENVGRFTSVAAKALKGRVLLYDASPLSNETSDNSRWLTAAEACWDALRFAKENGYEMLPFSKYANLFHKDFDNTEFIYVQHDAKSVDVSDTRLSTNYLPPTVTGNTTWGGGVFVTQDMVDRFEAIDTVSGGTIAKALPIDLAEEAGFYKKQNPYALLDPRFYYDIIYHGKSTHKLPDGGMINIKIDKVKGKPERNSFDMSSPNGLDMIQSQTNFTNKTGYYIGKFWDGATSANLHNAGSWALPCPIIRMAELYLNYAEAVNEAYKGGAGTVSGANLSALDAVNAVRKRVNMPDVDSRFTVDYTKLRGRILNERAVELCFEANHPYVDVRRWKLIETDDYRDTYKMMITANPSGITAEYPTGNIYTKEFYEKRSYNPRMYFFPIPLYDILKYPTFLQNPGY